MTSLLVVVLLGGLMHAARSFRVAEATGSSGTLLSFGYLLLTAHLVGGLFKRVGLPRLTGYIATGIAVGPAALGLVPERATDSLQIFSGVAVALIALTAGTELELRAMRPLLRSIAWITLLAVGGTTVLLAVVVYAVRAWLPFMGGMSTTHALLVSLVLGVVMVAQSPAVVVALRKEMEAEGPVARTVLGVVVLADLLVILLFAIVSTIARSSFGQGGGLAAVAPSLVWELLGSLVAGVLVGGVLAVFLLKVRGGAALFVLTMGFVVAEAGRRLHLDPLLVALAAGIFIRNATSVGDALHEGIEGSSLPVYVVFFAVAGATIHLDALPIVGPAAALFVVTRGVGLVAGTSLAAHVAGAPPAVRRWAGLGLVPQAGLALALASLFAKAFPEFGHDASALTLSVVAINEIVAPALYRWALVRSGEAGAGAPPPSAHEASPLRLDGAAPPSDRGAA